MNIVEPADEEFLTPGEVARLLHVSSKTVNRWANERRIPCVMTLGGHRRFARADVDEAVRRMRELVPPPA
jgi:excisionase family DNA binding protein